MNRIIPMLIESSEKMKKIIKKGICSLLLLLLVGCTTKESIDTTEELVSVKPLQVTSDVRKEHTSFDVVADDFIKVYVEQFFDLEQLELKQKKLEEFAGDSSLELAISDVVALQSELSEYQKNNVLRTSASVTLVERTLEKSEVYKRGALYFADVTYKESSPAYAGSFERRKQYSFKVQESKIVSFKEVD